MQSEGKHVTSAKGRTPNLESGFGFVAVGENRATSFAADFLEMTF